MIIQKRRIRNLAANLPTVTRGTTLVLAITELGRFTARLASIGFSQNLTPGETVLPAVLGPVSRFNAEGKYIKHKDQPMETAYTQVEWRWTEHHGQDEVEQSKIVDRPYQRYPRTFVPPPGVELNLAVNTDGDRMLITPATLYAEENDDRLRHTINLLLELFGECTVLDQHLDSILCAEVRRLNWRVLPPGERPWSQLETEIEPILKNQTTNAQHVFKFRLEIINKYSPTFVAVGQAGFAGYIVFGFPGKNRYVLESIQPNNATYVFAESWELLSQMTKAEILNQNLQTDRIIHREGWPVRVHHTLC